ncbi:MAG: hypothetical protein LBP59_06775, partial [Planctomycetaceae bacterium]|nr:hypothetical protein [Planctomycetaceae bacterium]
MTNQHKTINIYQPDQSNCLYNADAFEILPCLKDDSIDLIICDGPYGVTNNAWDKVDGIQKFNLNLIKIFSQ